MTPTVSRDGPWLLVDVEASILADAAGARRRHLAQRAQRILQEFHGVTA
jgi:hypothetical protein